MYGNPFRDENETDQKKILELTADDLHTQKFPYPFMSIRASLYIPEV
jgi:hypothetical protein